MILAHLLVVATAVAAPPTDSLAREVRAVETAFAHTMAARDTTAFLAFLSDEAVFFGRSTVQRGPTAIFAVWRRFFDGADAPFSWRPESVEVLDSGALALSSGPVFDPTGTRIGTFNSVWRRDADGRWRIIFDKGCPPCECPPPGKP